MRSSPGELAFHPTVEEVSDVGVLLRLPDVELPQAEAREVRWQRVDLDWRECDAHRQLIVGLVLGQGRQRETGGNAAAIEGVEVRQREGGHQLARAVSAEVHVDHRIAVPHRPALANHGGLDELVAHVAGVGLLDGLAGATGSESLPVHDRIPCSLRTLPASVPIHSEVAAAHCRDRRSPREGRLEGRKERPGGAGWSIPPIGEGMQQDALSGQAATPRQLRHGDDLLVDRVDPARTDEAQQVDAGAAREGVVHRTAKRSVLIERAVGDRPVDARQILDHGEAGAQVEVADL